MRRAEPTSRLVYADRGRTRAAVRATVVEARAKGTSLVVSSGGWSGR